MANRKSAKKKPHKPHNHAPLREICACGATRVEGGDWVEAAAGHGKDPMAQALVQKYLAQSTPEERSEKASQAAAVRWAGMSKRARTQYMRQIAQLPRPNRVIQNRCPCGKFSKTLAAKRGHKCTTTNPHN